MNRDSKGIVVGMIETHAQEILEMGGEHTPNAQAFLLFGNVEALKQDEAFHLYDMHIIKVPAARKKGEAVTDKDALFINVGASDILYKSFIAKVTLPTNAYITLSYRIIKSLNNPKVFSGTAKKEGFLNHVTTTLKADWLYTQVSSVPTSCSKTAKINEEESNVQYGYIHVKSDKITEVLKRSGQNGATIWRQGHDVSTVLIELPRKTVHKDALDIIKRVGDASLGLINKNNGRWCIRVIEDEAMVRGSYRKN